METVVVGGGSIAPCMQLNPLIFIPTYRLSIKPPDAELSPVSTVGWLQKDKKASLNFQAGIPDKVLVRLNCLSVPFNQGEVRTQLNELFCV